jgi:hypothetical protein
MAKQTYEDFLKTVRPEQLGADGRFLGPQSGTAYYAEGMTPQDFYNAHTNDQVATGGFTGYGDNMQAAMGDAGPVSADWVEGPTGNRGLFGGVSDMMTNPKTLMGLLAMGGIGALTGFGGAGAAAGAGEAAGFSGIGGTGGSAGLGSGTALGGAELAGAGIGAGEAAGAGLAGAAGAGEAAGFAGIGGTGGAAGIGSGTALGGASAAGGGGLLGGVKDLLSNPSDLMKYGGMALGALGGAAASKDSTTSKSSTNEPWAEAKPYLLDNLKTNAAMQDYYRQNPFSDLQKQQYQGLFDSLANSKANVPGLLANANSFSQSRRGQMPAMQGLLSGTQAAPINFAQYANIGRKG